MGIENKSLEDLLESHYSEETEEEDVDTNETEEKEEDKVIVDDDKEEGDDEKEDEKKEDEHELEFVLNPDDNEEENPDGDDKSVATIDDKAFFEFASKKLGREITSYDDLSEQTKNVEENEQLSQLRKFVEETNRDVRDWFKMESINIDSMTDEQLVKEDMRMKYGNQLTSSQIDKKFNNEYKLDKEQYETDDVELAEINLKVSASEAKARLSQLKTGYKIPIEKHEDTGNITEAQKKQFKADKDAYLKRMNSEVDSLEFFDFEVDGQTVKYKLSKEDIKEIKDRNKNLETYLNQFRDNDGNIDIKALSFNSFSTRENMAKILKAVKGRYITQGVDKQVSRQKNTKLPDNTGAKVEDTESVKKVKSKFAETLLNEMGGKKKQRIKL